jgi:hypothetical protein
VKLGKGNGRNCINEKKGPLYLGLVLRGRGKVMERGAGGYTPCIHQLVSEVGSGKAAIIEELINFWKKNICLMTFGNDSS